MRRAVLVVCLLLLPWGLVSAADRPKTAKPSTPLRMEALEVRGLRERPEALYVPVHRGIPLSPPVRYDLFVSDLTRPVTLREMKSQTPSLTAGTTD